MLDQAKGLRDMVFQNKAIAKTKMRVISVTSGKGGVGKTNFTVNLALALVEHGFRVVVMDGDLGLANVDVACGITPKYTMQHMLVGEKTIEEILVSGPKGIRILPGGSGVQELANLDRPRMQHVLKNLGRLENIADLLIIDTGAGISETVLNFLRASDDIILVTTPEPTSLTDAYGLLKTLRSGSKDIKVNVVVNRVRLESDAKAAFERLQIAVNKFLHGSLNLLGWVYEDPLVSQSVMNQEPLGTAHPQSSAYRCIQWIAGSVAGICLRPPRQSEGIRGFLSNLLRSL